MLTVFNDYIKLVFVVAKVGWFTSSSEVTFLHHLLANKTGMKQQKLA